MRTTQAGFKRGQGAETPADLLVKLGPTLLVDVGHRSRAAPDAPPNLPAKRIRALLDTGAGMDGIDETVARDLNLPVTDEMEISGIGGRHRTLVYLARLYIPSLERLLFQPFAGVKLVEGDQWHRIILGRNFLRGYRTTYDGTTGDVILTEVEIE